MRVRDFLAGLQNRAVYFDPLRGNHGDRLILLAARGLLKEAGARLVERPDAADCIVVNGGGSMAEEWFGLQTLARYNRLFPAIPLAVLPSSFHVSEHRLSALARGRQAPMWLWARERPSYTLLQTRTFASEVHVELDHDLAFTLDHRQLAGGRQLPHPHHVLVVERDDWEGPTGRRRPLSPPGLNFIPQSLRTRLRKTLLGPIRRRQDLRSPFAAAAREFVYQHHPHAGNFSVVVADISLAETCTFDDFLDHIHRASIIISTRLHVAILGHLLGRTTYLVEGRYHKYRGVFDYSMRGGSTQLLTWNDRDLLLTTRDEQSVQARPAEC